MLRISVCEKFPFVRTLWRGDVPRMRSDLWLADVLDPLPHQATEGGHSLVLHSVFGHGLGIREDSFELAARLFIGRQETLVAREKVSPLARLKIDHQSQELLRIIRELQIVLDKSLELLLELFVGRIGPCKADAQHRYDEQRAQKDSPEECALEDPHRTPLRGWPIVPRCRRATKSQRIGPKSANRATAGRARWSRPAASRPPSDRPLSSCNAWLFSPFDAIGQTAMHSSPAWESRMPWSPTAVLMALIANFAMFTWSISWRAELLESVAPQGIC